MTPERLAKLRAQGFSFDEAYDAMAERIQKQLDIVAEKNVKKVTIKFINCEANDKDYILIFEVTAQNLKSKDAKIFVEELDKFFNDEAVTSKFEINPNGNSKVVLKFSKSKNFTEWFFDDGNIFQATISVDGLTAVSDKFVLKVIKKTNAIKENPNKRFDVKDLKPSTKFKLWLKNMEGLGYNVIYKNKEIERIFPYDDGGKMGVGNATIGYGHLIDYEPFDEKNVRHKKWKNGIMLVEAEELFLKDVGLKTKVLINGLGDKKTSGIKVKLLQREYDALLLAIFNGGYGDTLEKMVNKGVENLTKEEIFQTFLLRRNKGTNTERGLIKRRASEAYIFVYDNWEPYPSDKFNNDNEFIKAFEKFLQNGIFPIIVFFLLFLVSCNKINNDTTNKTVINTFPNHEYQQNELLQDNADHLLSKLDTVLLFTSRKLFYEVKIKNEKVTVSVTRWNEAVDGKIAYKDEGYHKNGFIYIQNNKNEYELKYKVILGKALFIWNDNNWMLINSGNY